MKVSGHQPEGWTNFVQMTKEAQIVCTNFMAILRDKNKKCQPYDGTRDLERSTSNMLMYEVVFLPKEEGLLVDFASQHLTMSSIRLVNPASPVAWHLISSIDGRSPSGIRNRTMLDLASTEEKQLKLC